MCRLNTMARFNEEVPENVPVEKCEQCTEELYEYDNALKYDDMNFCDRYCLMDYLLEEGIAETTVITKG